MPVKQLIIDRPNPKQAQFFTASSRYIAYGGARGGGKSWAVRKKAMLLALNYGGIRILIIRRTFPELRENHILPLMSELSRTDEIILTLKYAGRRAAGSAIQWYGLDTSSVIVEQAPLVIPSAHENEKRIQRAK